MHAAGATGDLANDRAVAECAATARARTEDIREHMHIRTGRVAAPPKSSRDERWAAGERLACARGPAIYKRADCGEVLPGQRLLQQDRENVGGAGYMRYVPLEQLDTDAGERGRKAMRGRSMNGAEEVGS